MHIIFAVLKYYIKPSSLDLRALIISNLSCLLLVPRYQSRLWRVWRTSYCPVPGQIVSFWSTPSGGHSPVQKQQHVSTIHVTENKNLKRQQMTNKHSSLHTKTNQFHVKMNLLLFMHGYYLLFCIIYIWNQCPLTFFRICLCMQSWCTIAIEQGEHLLVIGIKEL